MMSFKVRRKKYMYKIIMYRKSIPKAIIEK